MEIEQIKKMYPEGCVVRCACESSDIGFVDYETLRKDLHNDWLFHDDEGLNIYLTHTSINKTAEIIAPAPAPNQYPKVMWVWFEGGDKQKRVVFMEKKGKYLAWDWAKTLEEAEQKLSVTQWDYAKDIDPAPETIQHEGITYKLVKDEN